MFSKTNYHNTSSSDQKLIYAILAIQLANFKPGDMRNLSTDDYAALKKLVIKMGNQLIKKNLEKMGELNSYLSVKKNYADIIRILSQPDTEKKRECFIRYAAQLIQYYVLVSEQQCPEEQDLQAFQQFLDTKKVVNANMNLYIIEHQILIIYQELYLLENDMTHRSMPRAALEAKLNLMNAHLQKSRDIIDSGKIDAPYNVFVFYLGVAINYTCSRLIQLSISLQLSLGDKKEVSIYEKLAMNDLQAIDVIKAECEQHKISYANGFEFSFGQDKSRKFDTYSEKNSECLSNCSKL